MSFVIKSEEFSKKLGMILGIVERRTTMPILSHVLLSSSNGKLTLQGTDLANTVTVSCDVQTGEDIHVAVPADTLSELIKEFNDQEDISVKATEKSWIEVSGGAGEFKMAGLPGEDFPEGPEIELDNMFAISSKKLEKLISRTVFCISDDDMRKNLFGLFFEKRGDQKLRLVATDGHRLSFAEEKVEGLVLQDNVLVSKKAVVEIMKLLRFSEEVRIGVSGKHFVFECPSENLRLVSRLRDEPFPDYMQVVPASTKNTATLNSLRLLSALRRVSIFSPEAESGKFVEMRFSEGELHLDAHLQTGDGEETIPVDYSEEEVRLGFNGGYFQDVLEVIGSPEVQICFSGNKNPVCVLALDKGEKREGYMNVIMPMDLREKPKDGGKRSSQ